MAFLGLFGGTIEQKIARKKKVMLNEHQQQQVRQEAIQGLVDFDCPEAIMALVERLGVNFRDTIKNEQEREWVSHLLLTHFKARSVEPLKSYISGGTQLAGALQCLQELIEDEEYRDFILETLCRYAPADHRTETAREQLVDALSEIEDEEIVEPLLPYVLDHCDDVRIKVISILEQRALAGAKAQEAIAGALVGVLCDPLASGRISRAAGQALVGMRVTLKEWREELEENLPEGFKLHQNRLQLL